MWPVNPLVTHVVKVFAVSLLLLFQGSHGYKLTLEANALKSTFSASPTLTSTRRTWLSGTAGGLLSVFYPQRSLAAATTSSPADDIRMIEDGASTLGTLLDNWERATVDCTYADVPRELLEQKNKEELLEKASTFALFDKSTSVVSCKKTNRIVRDYIGVTGKGPLVGAEKRMLKRSVADEVDPDRLDDYYSEVESFSRAISKASSFSYAAGVADFDSVNNFDKDNAANTSGDTNLVQAKEAIQEAKNSMDKIVALLSVDSDIAIN